jgi:GNAT superfamily N-acetyltransferase
MRHQEIIFKDIVMKIQHDDIKKIEIPPLHDYAFRFYEAGDMETWAMITHAAGEFETKAAALAYFRKIFLLDTQALSQRMVFLMDDKQVSIGTGCAWFFQDQPLLHYIAVKPSHQGQGLGRALAALTTRLFLDLHPHQDPFLKTQTTSYKAVKLYHSLGYHMIKANSYYGKQNDFDGAIAVLSEILDGETVAGLIKNAQ